MARQPAEDAVGVLAGCLSLAAWFEAASETALGAYTAGVGRYLQEKRPQRYWQEDVIFCGRRRVEYHLNMVGAEIMNRSLRADFLATQKKAVVLPACLRLRRAEECRAQDAGSHLVCTACLADCPVAVLTRAGKKGGFAVLMVPHESSLSAARTDSSFLSPDVGVVGIACVLNLIAGGWMLRRKGIATQCVLLDWCGCKKHWSDEGRPTAINLGQLMRVLDLAGRS